MPLSIQQKFRIQNADHLLAINAPNDFFKTFNQIDVTIVTSVQKKYNQIHCFVKNIKEAELWFDKILKKLLPNIIAWIYFPKKTSGIQTDLSRDHGWDKLFGSKYSLTYISLISFNSTWSVFGIRLKTNVDIKKASLPKKREIFNWVNASTKEIKLPIDVAVALKKHLAALHFFNSLSFTGKKEYLEWIISAKKEETRKLRISKTIERLTNLKKTPIGNF